MEYFESENMLTLLFSSNFSSEIIYKAVLIPVNSATWLLLSHYYISPFF